VTDRHTENCRSTSMLHLDAMDAAHKTREVRNCRIENLRC